MSGLMSAYKEKQQVADSFIEKLKPYDKITPLKFDLHGYAKYLKENEISGKNVPSDVVEKFKK